MNAPKNLVHCLPVHIAYLAERMRPDEIEQWLAFTGYDTYTPESFCNEVEAMQGPRFTVLQSDGYPAAAGGFYCVGDGVWQSWMVGTMEGWEKNWRALTKTCRWFIAAMLSPACGAKKLQTFALASRTHAMEWYARGLQMECERLLDINGFAAAKFVRGG